MRAVGAIVGVALGIYAQFILIASAQLLPALIIYVIAGVAVALSLWGQAAIYAPALGGSAAALSRRRRTFGALVLVAATAAAVWASREATVNFEQNIDRSLLVIFLALLLALFGLSRLEGWSVLGWAGGAARGIRAHPLETVLVIGFLAIGLWFRAGHLDYYPPPGGVAWVDEGQIGKEAQNILRGQRPWQYPLSIYPVALSFAVMGESVLALRIPTVVWGWALLVPFYFLARWMIGTPGALIALFLFAVSRWQAAFSRVVLDPIQWTFLEVCCFLLFYRGIATGNLGNFLIAGFLTVAGLYGYAGTRLTPILLLTLIGVLTLRWLFRLTRDPEARAWPSIRARLRFAGLALVAYLAGAATIGAPYLAIVLRNPYSAFTERFLNSTPALARGDTAALLSQRTIDQARAVFSVFNYRGDAWGAINIPGNPMLDQVSGLLLVLGFGYALFQFWRGANGFLLLWFLGTMIGGGVLAPDMHSHRYTGAVPALFLFTGLFGSAMLSGFGAFFGSIGRGAVLAAFVPALAVAGWLNYDFFFNQHMTSRVARIEFIKDTSAIAAAIAEEPGRPYVFMLAPSPFIDRQHDLGWLSGNPQGRASGSIADVLPARDATNDALYVFSQPYDVDGLVKMTQELYPGSTVKYFEGEFNVYRFATVRVPAASIQQMRGLTARYQSGGNSTVEATASLPVEWLASPTGETPFSGVLTGSIYVPTSAEYVMQIEGTGRSEATIGDSITITSTEQTVRLIEGWHPIRIETRQMAVPGALRLLWQSTGARIERGPVTGNFLVDQPPPGGLLARYFEGRATTGQPALQRIEPTLLFTGVPSWHSGTPTLRLAGKPFVGVWSGRINFPTDGEYRFRALCWQGRARLEISGTAVIDAPRPPEPICHQRTTFEGSLRVAAGWQDFTARFDADAAEYHAFHLHWVTPEGVEEPIPPHLLELRDGS